MDSNPSILLPFEFAASLAAIRIESQKDAILPLKPIPLLSAHPFSSSPELCTCSDRNGNIFPFTTMSDKEVELLCTPARYSSHRFAHAKHRRAIQHSVSLTLMAPADICPRRLIDTHLLKIFEFSENTGIPPYAILSHRWIKGEEVGCEEFLQRRDGITSTSGYRKIEAACQQARNDGIRYIWIDTCCIDRGNHADVKLNITSMYAYYQNAIVCYAYLADIPGPEKSLGLSKWFERAWTLQELLAPKTVIFFDKHWQLIGDKCDLGDEIYRRTTISPAVLSSEQSIEDVDVLTRMSWASGRLTTKPQDRAYCLQGLLNIIIEPDYDEDSFTSFERLWRALFEAQPDLKGKLGDLLRSHRWIQKEGRSIINPASPALMSPIHVCPHRLVDAHTLKLVEFNNSTVIPQYAILSHRWIPDEEIVYEEFLQPRAETSLKRGYQKIEAACRQARKNNIRYIWVDTCCIKQGDHADVTENIISMYAYYQNAEICYTYLTYNGSINLFNNDGWFLRGWTLQELLAPRTVMFFNWHWHCIGDKHLLRNRIHHITTIPLAVLSGEQSLHDVDILTRMSWAVHRKTTRLHDSAYCLQGLLGISVDPDYDEYWLISFNRLGKVLFRAHPDLKKRLGVNEDLFLDPYSYDFRSLIWDRLLVARKNYDHTSIISTSPCPRPALGYRADMYLSPKQRELIGKLKSKLKHDCTGLQDITDTTKEGSDRNGFWD
ncbi:hypothetical protein VKT23_015718 [Stygiomarasmius scandens]|uniref:Heterokaryon incompatibility domain-containing protein n=1 Tax=Marasmiellus scandens TaxID=2682957 RepID=A0ABR1IZC2_9AGAR